MQIPCHETCVEWLQGWVDLWTACEFISEPSRKILMHFTFFLHSTFVNVTTCIVQKRCGVIFLCFQSAVAQYSTWHWYYAEILMLLGLACYLLNYIMGRTRNQSLAVAWWVKCVGTCACIWLYLYVLCYLICCVNFHCAQYYKCI